MNHKGWRLIFIASLSSFNWWTRRRWWSGIFSLSLAIVVVHVFRFKDLIWCVGTTRLWDDGDDDDDDAGGVRLKEIKWLEDSSDIVKWHLLCRNVDHSAVTEWVGKVSKQAFTCWLRSCRILSLGRSSGALLRNLEVIWNNCPAATHRVRLLSEWEAGRQAEEKRRT